MQVYKITEKENLICDTINRNIKDDEVKIKLTKAIFSSSDISIYNGFGSFYPIIPLNTAVGLVSEAPESSGLQIGERVYISPYIVDSENENSVKMMGVDCDGLLGDYAIVPLSNVYLIPEGVSEKDAVFTDHIATALRVIDTLNLDKMQYVVIMNCDCLSILIAELCIYYQTIPILIDKSVEKLSIANECGIYYTVNASEEDPVIAVNSITGGALADATIFSATEGISVSNAVHYTKQKGKIGFVSRNKFLNTRINFDMKGIIKNELTLFGINNGYNNIASAINLIANKQLKLDKLIDKEISVKNIKELFEEVKTQASNLKTLILF